MTNIDEPNVSYHIGDMFTTTAPAISHGINIKGLAGAGIARIVRKKYPEFYAPYKEACDDRAILPGGMLPVQAKDGTWILNIASQDNPGANARLDWLESGVEEAFVFCIDNSLASFAIPQIGAGIGGLQWKDVRETLENVASHYPSVHLEIWSLPTK